MHRRIRKRIEVVITGLTRNQVVLTGSWVRIPPLPPLIKGTHPGAFYHLYRTADSGGIRRRPCLKSKRQRTFKTKSVLWTDFRESAYKAYNESRCYQTTCNSPTDSAYTASAIDKKAPVRVPFIIYTECGKQQFFLLHMSCIDIIVPV